MANQMNGLKVPGGTKVVLGSPAVPPPREKVEALERLVASTPGILEAHLPQCFAVSVMAAPAQVFVLSVPLDADVEAIVESIGRGLSRIIPAGEHLDIWPMSPGDPMLNSVQNARSQIFPSIKTRPWWKFW